MQRGRVTSRIASRAVQLVLLAFAMALAGYVRTAVSPLQEAMQAALSLTDNQIAMLQGPIIGIPVLLASIPLGVLIDRYSRVRILLALILLSIAGSLLTASAPGFSTLLFARCLAGLTGLAILPVVFSLIADLYAPAERGVATTVAIVGQVVGNSAAFALGGMLLACCAADGWQVAMLWLVVPLAPIVLMTMALREPERLQVNVVNPSAQYVIGELRRNKATLAPLAAGIMLAEIAIGAVIIWSAPMLSRRFALPPDEVGSIMGIAMLISGVLGPVIGGALADLCQRTGGPRRTISVLGALALLSAPASLFAFVPGVTGASILLIVALTLMFAIVVMAMALFSIVIAGEIRGLGMSVLVAAEILFALAFAPPMVSALSTRLGGPQMIGDALSIICAAAGLLAAAIFIVGRKNFSGTDSERSGPETFTEGVADAD